MVEAAPTSAVSADASALPAPSLSSWALAATGQPDLASHDGLVRHHVPMTKNETRRLQKGIESNAKAIENRIKLFKREEEKIWKDLEEVRRQAAKIEEGRSRTLEKKLATKSISQVRNEVLQENKQRVRQFRATANQARQQNAVEVAQQRRLAGDQQRKESREILQNKKREDAVLRLQKSEKVVSMTTAKLEAKLRANQERAERLAALRLEQEQERLAAEQEVQSSEARLPELEAEEMACLQRLQNSRVITQTVLQELEVSLGTGSAVTSLLRQKVAQYGVESGSAASASVPRLLPLEEAEEDARPSHSVNGAPYASIQNVQGGPSEGISQTEHDRLFGEVLLREHSRNALSY